MNTVNLVGELVRKFVTEGKGGKPWGTATIKATTYKGYQYIKVKAFGDRITSIDGFNEGDVLVIIGHMESGSYEKDGQKIYTQDVIVDVVTNVTGDNSNDKADEDSNEAVSAGVTVEESSDIPF